MNFIRKTHSLYSNIVAFGAISLTCALFDVIGVLNNLIFYLLMCLPISFCGPQPAEPFIIEGTTMGTTYRVVYFDAEHRNFKLDVDSLLVQVNKAISTYDPDSEIARFNRSENGICVQLPFFPDILKTAKKVYTASDGAFDPTVMPLVNAWGFGPQRLKPPTGQQVDSLRSIVGFNQVSFSGSRIMKENAGVQLDMGGIGQGYGADVIFQFLQSRGVCNMLVELGGEGIARGKNLQKGKPWTIGILDPNSTQDDQFFMAYVTLQKQAFTTSGNYFNYKVIDGRKFGHTIDPKTGYPIQHSLLSASVFSDDCATADSWATAFMVMGLEKAKEKLKTLKGIEALFIYSTDQGDLATYISPGLKKQVTMD
jgi:FAD:protein FMN transferase